MSVDYAMTKLRTLVQSLGISLIVISHTRRPDGNAGHERGQAVTLSHLRGLPFSRSVRCSDCIAGPRRTRQRHTALTRSGKTGSPVKQASARRLSTTEKQAALLEMEMADLTSPDEGEETDANSTAGDV